MDQEFQEPQETVRIKLTVAYVGTHYHGWQTQLRTDKTVLTVQSLLEAIASRICKGKVNVHGSGRTDAGVHAEAQVAHMDVPVGRADLDWQLAFNTGLPSDIRIMRVEPVPNTFHAQFSAVRKRYAYRLWLSRRCTPPWLYPFVWACGAVDVDAMDEAARLLEGTHDFTSLRNRGTDLPTNVRTVFGITRTPADLHGRCEGNIEMVWNFEANGFLKQMVRNSMGLLVAVGHGKFRPEDVPEVLAAKDRRQAGITAPACGLVLREVFY